MKQYEVLAPVVVFSIKDDKQTKEYTLKKGDKVDLPETDNVVKTLSARKQIGEVKETLKSPKK